MRITTWNVNGINSVLQYHPFNLKKTYESMLDILEADICCIQEHKITTAQITQKMACIPTYDSFFSVHRPAKGIHGTAIFTKRSVTVPLKAEEGLSSTLIPPTTTERIGGYPSIADIDLTLDEMKNLDLEGRTTVCDFGMFVLINLYCPCPTGEDQRTIYKDQFDMMIDERVRSLIRSGRQVIVVGDLNISHSGLNSDEEDRKNQRGRYSDYAPEKWLAEFVGVDGVVIDITRKFHPTRLEMNTCWETKISARASNFGSRIDYILVTPGLLPWIKDSDIQPLIQGSDHCPVYVDFHEEIEIEGKGNVRLWDLMNPGRSRDDEPPPPPPFAARNLEEFSGRQQRLSTFFVSKSAGDVSSGSASPLPPPIVPPTASSSSSATASTSTTPIVAAPRIPLRERPIAASIALVNAASASSSMKVKSNGKGKEKETVQQKSISSFFKPPVAAKPKKKKSTKAQSPIIVLDSSPPPESPPSRKSSNAPSTSQREESTGLDSIDLAEAEDPFAAFKAHFKQPPTPTCYVHDEPSKLWVVGKSGINRGRRFYLCSRPVGPDYDKGWNKEKGGAQKVVNPEFRCNFFEWETSVKRPAGTVLSKSDKKKTKS